MELCNTETIFRIERIIIICYLRTKATVPLFLLRIFFGFPEINRSYNSRTSLIASPSAVAPCGVVVKNSRYTPRRDSSRFRKGRNDNFVAYNCDL